MKRFTNTLALSLCLAATPLVFGDEGQLDMQDIQALRDWLNTKRQVTIREIGGNLSLSGEVRAELQCTNERVGGIRQRGSNFIGATPLPTNAYDIEVNVMLDYRADRTWGAIKLEFDNDAGLFNSTVNKLRLEKAYWGARIWDGPVATFDTEVGRRPLYTVFDSKVEFGSMSDGVLFRYDVSTDRYGDFYLHGMAELIDDISNQYAYIAELGWLSIWDTGLFFKYSLADWNTKDLSTPRNYRFDYIVNQWLMGYKWIPEKFGKLVMPYAAFLWNPSAPRIALTRGHKLNLGGYIGFSIGELRKKGDWAFDANYQALQAQCVPEFDLFGIGVGNAARTGFYTAKSDGTGGPNPVGKAGGNSNYRGFMLTLDYLITNNLNLQQQWLQTITLDKNLGPVHQYKQYEIEFVYGF